MFYVGSAFTSQEGILTISSFHVDSKGIGSSGPVAVQGTIDIAGEISLIVSAFGKTITIPKTVVEKIPKTFNGIQLSYEKGYESLGGRTIYIMFSTGFLSGQKTKTVLVVTEDGASEVSDKP